MVLGKYLVGAAKLEAIEVSRPRGASVAWKDIHATP
jgi:hypothetical protein